MFKIIEGPVVFFENFGTNMKVGLVAIGLGIFYFIFQLLDLESNKVVGFMVATAPVWLPITTFLLFYEYWMRFVQKQFDIANGRVTLEIKLPQEVFKSPEAMEVMLIQLHQSASPDNHHQTYWDGKHPPVYGLEIVSRAGDVRFYLSVPKKKFKNIAENQLYAQYPGIEIQELDIDYTAEIPWDTERFKYFSIHFGLKKADAYPIKTYIEYGLHMMPKEEEKVDPITPMLEMLGSMKQGEYMWMQILIDANIKKNFKNGYILGAGPDWTKDARGEIKKIIDTAVKERGGENGKGNVMMLLTDTEKETIRAIERSIGKNAFNTAIRCMYIAKKESYNPGEQIGAMITGWRAYDDNNRNSIGVRWRTDFDWNWWQDPSGKKKDAWKEQELDEYKRRAYSIHGNALEDEPKVMTTEELATIFHLPGKVATTPSLARIPSKRAEPPANLPIG